MEKTKGEHAIDLSSITTSSEVDIDNAFEQAGSYGKFQIAIQLFFMYSIFVSSYQTYINIFSADDPSWVCVNGNSSRFCKQHIGKEIKINNPNFSKRCSLKRDEWKYTKEKSYSYVTEFDLICDNKSVVASISGIVFLGSGIASIVSGMVADLHGRKLVLLSSLSLLSTFSIASSFITEIWLLIVLRVLIGAGQGIFICFSYIYLAEFISKSCRPISAMTCHVAITLSMLSLTTVAYLVADWRKLQLYTSLPCIVAIFGCTYLPQSPRWLLVTGKVAKAEEIIKWIARTNGKTFKGVKLKIPDKVDTFTKKKYTFLDLFRRRQTIKIVFAIGMLWLIGGSMYFAITLQASSIGENIYSSYVLVAAPDLPCCFLTIYLCKRFGRKKTVLFAYLFSGLATGSITMTLKTINSNYAIVTFLSILGKCALNISCNGGYLWTFELFPTVLRTQGFSICLMMSNIGSAGAPFLHTYLQAINPALPYELIAILGILAAFVGKFLPETIECPTKEHYQDFFRTKKNITDWKTYMNEDIFYIS